MKASFTIPADGTYVIRVLNEAEDAGAPPFAMQLYRNRTRLTSTATLHEIRWRGRCEKDDLIEADGEHGVTLTVVEEQTQPGDINRSYTPVQTHAHHSDSRNDDPGHPVAPV